MCIYIKPSCWLLQIHSGSSTGKELYIENIFEELDEPGEWFYDERDQYLYYMTNDTVSPPRDVWATRLRTLFGVYGSMARPVCDSFVVIMSRVRVNIYAIGVTAYSGDWYHHIWDPFGTH